MTTESEKMEFLKIFRIVNIQENIMKFLRSELLLIKNKEDANAVYQIRISYRVNSDW